jgi:hypothetical protein
MPLSKAGPFRAGQADNPNASVFVGCVAVLRAARGRTGSGMMHHGGPIAV